MSVLSFPRIYFKGMMSWDPCTFNNNDWQEFPTYDGVNAALNWPFLATQGITPQNFYSTFRPWAIALQPDCVDSPGGERVPAEWNMFGTHGVSFVQYPQGGFQTTITGGALGYNQPVTSDPLIGLRSRSRATVGKDRDASSIRIPLRSGRARSTSAESRSVREIASSAVRATTGCIRVGSISAGSTPPTSR